MVPIIPLGVLFVVDIVLMLVAGLLLLTIITKVRNVELRLLSVTLSSFAVTHSMYHLAGALGNTRLSLGLLQPLSVGFLIAFGILLLRRG